MNPSRCLRLSRESAGLTQVELARRSGTTQSAVAAYETGVRVPTPETLRRLLERAEFRPSRVLKLLRDQVLHAAASNHASNVRVFGSVARGEDGVGSDIDLLVTFDPVATLFDQGALLEEQKNMATPVTVGSY